MIDIAMHRVSSISFEDISAHEGRNGPFYTRVLRITTDKCDSLITLYTADKEALKITA